MPTNDLSWAFSLVEAFLFAQADMMPAPEAFLAGTLHISLPVRNRKTWRPEVAPPKRTEREAPMPPQAWRAVSAW